MKSGEVPMERINDREDLSDFGCSNNPTVNFTKRILRKSQEPRFFELGEQSNPGGVSGVTDSSAVETGRYDYAIVAVVEPPYAESQGHGYPVPRDSLFPFGFGSEDWQRKIRLKKDELNLF